MTIDIPAGLLTRSSGSAGDVVSSHNQFGPYTRARTVPTDPATALQLEVRAHLSECVTAWNATLSSAERKGWDAYALAVRTTTALGRSTNPGGLAAFVRANVPRLQAAEVSLPRVDQAPTLFDSGDFTPIVRVVLNIVDDTLHPFFDDTDPWVTETGAAALFYASAPQALTRNFWAGPYRFAGSLLGTDPLLSSPGTIPLPVPTAVDQRVFVRGRITRADARLSHAFRVPADIVPQVPPLPVSALFTPTAPGRGIVNITFDSPIRRESHSALNWSVRFDDLIYTVSTATTFANGIRLIVRSGAIQVGIPQVSYAPPPFDVNGLLTGLSVASFTIRLD